MNDTDICFSCGHPGQHRNGYDCVKAERDRLREALERIASTDAPLSQDDMQIARDALDA